MCLSLDLKPRLLNSLAIQPFGFQRIIVFLTDGVHNDQNDPVVKVDPILSSCRNNNIQFFAITFQANMNNELSYIAQNTNGDDYVVASVDGLTQIYKLIANKIHNELLCSLTWESTLICDDIDRLKVAKYDTSLIVQHLIGLILFLNMVLQEFSPINDNLFI